MYVVNVLGEIFDYSGGYNPVPLGKPKPYDYIK